MVAVVQTIPLESNGSSHERKDLQASNGISVFMAMNLNYRCGTEAFTCMYVWNVFRLQSKP